MSETPQKSQLAVSIALSKVQKLSFSDATSTYKRRNYINYL